jgi:hypothetical protein
MKKISILSASLLLTTGCSTITVSDCDPAIEHNTITNAGCLFSGKYGERQENLQLTIEEERGVNESLTQIHTLLDEERRGVSKSLSATQAQYGKRNRYLTKLISRISSRSSGNVALQQRVAKLQAKKDKVLSNPSASGARKQLELDSLYTEVEGLKKELGY